MSIASYIQDLPVSSELAPIGRIRIKGEGGAQPPKPSLPDNLQAAVDVGSILSFVSGVDSAEKSDILFSVQLASRAADAAFNRYSQTQRWYEKYGEVLQAVGWTTEQFAFAAHDQSAGELKMDKAALDVIKAIATQNQFAIITTSISALEKLAAGDEPLTLFDFHASADGSGNFQIGAVEKGNNGALSMALGAFYFRATDHRTKFLFFSWGQNDINFWTAAQKMTFNTAIYAKLRADVEKKLGDQALDFIAALNIR